jgi:hypothetical protein
MTTDDSTNVTRQEYGQRLSTFARQDLLKLCRAGGFTAHKLATNKELIDLLYHAFGRKQQST